MEVKAYKSGLLSVNTYFLIAKDNTAVVIDGGENYEFIKKIKEQLNVKIVALLLTHAHFDHCGNAKNFAEDGVKIYVSEKDGEKLFNGDTLCKDFHKPFYPVKADVILKDGDLLKFSDIEIKVMETSGHTDGSVCFIVEDKIFSGDTLFCESVGRTDFPTGSLEQMKVSIKRLLSLEGEYEVFPGHEEKTTLSHERKFNPFR